MHLTRLRNAAVLIALVCYLCSGCWDQRPLEDLGLIYGLGLDRSEFNENLFVVTTVYPLFADTRRAPNEVDTVTAPSFGLAVEQWRNRHAQQFAPRKLRVILLGEDLARKGAEDPLLSVMQYTQLNEHARLAVARPRAEDLLRVKPLANERVATFTEQLLLANEQVAAAAQVTLSEAISRFSAADSDPLVPILAEDKMGERLVVIGSGLFSGLKMVGELDERETQLVLAMRGDVGDVVYSPATGVTDVLLSSYPQVRMQNPKAKYRVKLDGERLRVKVELHTGFSLQQYSSAEDMSDTEDTNSVAQSVASNLTLAIEDLIAKMQATTADPLGLGQHLRVKQGQDFDIKLFREQWRNAEVEVGVKTAFIRCNTMNTTIMPQKK